MWNTIWQCWITNGNTHAQRDLFRTQRQSGSQRKKKENHNAWQSIDSHVITLQIVQKHMRAFYYYRHTRSCFYCCATSSRSHIHTMYPHSLIHVLRQVEYMETMVVCQTPRARESRVWLSMAYSITSIYLCYAHRTNRFGNSVCCCKNIENNKRTELYPTMSIAGWDYFCPIFLLALLFGRTLHGFGVIWAVVSVFVCFWWEPLHNGEL